MLISLFMDFSLPFAFKISIFYNKKKTRGDYSKKSQYCEEFIDIKFLRVYSKTDIEVKIKNENLENK